MKPLPVTKSFMPPFSEFNEMIQECWSSQHLTNNGPLLQKFEKEIAKVLKVPRALCVSNGTIALQLAIRALNLKGKIITTPYSYVATTSSILWEHCQPVFADISPFDLNIDSEKIEELIDNETTAILAVHVYGNPCDVGAIQKIADKYSLKVIYDAAHAFGVEYQDTSIASFGDISTFSLHATKLIHSVEGGVVVCNDKRIHDRISLQRAFGHNDDNHLLVGINGKMSELHAAMGLCVLKYVDHILDKRKGIFKIYQSRLGELGLETPGVRAGTKPNYSYFPVLFENQRIRDSVHEKLKKSKIFTRKYFYPSLNQLPYLTNLTSHNCPISESATSRTLCLPLYTELELPEVNFIMDSLQKAIGEV